MGLEDDVHAHRQQRQAESGRFVGEAKEAQRALDELIAEFYATLAERSDLSPIPVYECRSIKHPGLHGGGNFTTFHPTRKMLGNGWLFHSFHDYGDGVPSRRPLVLMDDGRTLINPHLRTALTRLNWGLGSIRIHGTGFWPKGDFVCWDSVYRVPVTYDCRNQVATIRAGIVRFLA